jgi:hypothetical protein
MERVIYEVVERGESHTKINVMIKCKSHKIFLITQAGSRVYAIDIFHVKSRNESPLTGAYHPRAAIPPGTSPPGSCRPTACTLPHAVLTTNQSVSALRGDEAPPRVAPAPDPAGCQNRERRDRRPLQNSAQRQAWEAFMRATFYTHAQLHLLTTHIHPRSRRLNTMDPHQRAQLDHCKRGKRVFQPVNRRK